MHHAYAYMSMVACVRNNKASVQKCPEYLVSLCTCAALSLAWVIGLATYFANGLSGWYSLTFEGTFEIMMTCLLVFTVLTPIANSCALARISSLASFAGTCLIIIQGPSPRQPMRRSWKQNASLSTCAPVCRLCHQR